MKLMGMRGLYSRIAFCRDRLEFAFILFVACTFATLLYLQGADSKEN